MGDRHDDYHPAPWLAERWQVVARGATGQTSAAVTEPGDHGELTQPDRPTVEPVPDPAERPVPLSVKSSETVMVSLFGSRWVLAG